MLETLRQKFSRIRSAHLFLVLLVVLASVHLGTTYAGSLGRSDSEAVAGEGPVSLTGRLIDPQGEPIRGAELHLLLNRGSASTDREKERSHSSAQSETPGQAESQPDGTFVLEIPGESVGNIEILSIQVSRPHFKSSEWEIIGVLIGRLNNGESVRLPDWVLERQITAGFSQCWS
jgi:hypothetical protein